MSSDIANNNFLKFSACLLFEDFCSIKANFVKPSTMFATCSPKSCFTSSTVVSVSSTVSCKSAATIEAESNLNFVNIPATSIGCE